MATTPPKKVSQNWNDLTMGYSAQYNKGSLTKNPAILSNDLLFTNADVPEMYFEQLTSLGAFINQYLSLPEGSENLYSLRNLITEELKYIDNTIGRYYAKKRADRK